MDKENWRSFCAIYGFSQDVAERGARVIEQIEQPGERAHLNPWDIWKRVAKELKVPLDPQYAER